MGHDGPAVPLGAHQYFPCNLTRRWQGVPSHKQRLSDVPRSVIHTCTRLHTPVLDERPGAVAVLPRYRRRLRRENVQILDPDEAKVEHGWTDTSGYCWRRLGGFSGGSYSSSSSACSPPLATCCQLNRNKRESPSSNQPTTKALPCCLAPCDAGVFV